MAVRPLAEQVAVVGGEHHQRLTGQPQRLQPVEDLPDLAVQQADHPVVAGDVPGQFLPVVEMRGEPAQPLAALPPWERAQARPGSFVPALVSPRTVRAYLGAACS